MAYVDVKVHVPTNYIDDTVYIHSNAPTVVCLCQLGLHVDCLAMGIYSSPSFEATQKGRSKTCLPNQVVSQQRYNNMEEMH